MSSLTEATGGQEPGMLSLQTGRVGPCERNHVLLISDTWFISRPKVILSPLLKVEFPQRRGLRPQVSSRPGQFIIFPVWSQGNTEDIEFFLSHVHGAFGVTP